jgi:natural product precursor
MIMKNMKLNALENQNLNNKEMNAVRGGDGCCCGCNYQGQQGGSSTADNNSANTAGGLSSPGCQTYQWQAETKEATYDPPKTQSPGAHTPPS